MEHAEYTHLQITLDGHKKDHNKVRYVSSTKGSYDTIIQNIIKLVNYDFNVRLRINYTLDNLNKCSEILSDLSNIQDSKKKNLTISFHCVWQEISKMKDRQKDVFQQMSYFVQKGYNVDSPQSLRAYEQLCYADKINTAVINYNGDVFKCTARDFTESNREGTLVKGRIKWDDELVKKRVDSMFSNKACLNCRLLPHCFGGCTQIKMEALESGNTYCLHNFNETQKDNIILEHIERLLDMVEKKHEALKK